MDLYQLSQSLSLEIHRSGFRAPTLPDLFSLLVREALYHVYILTHHVNNVKTLTPYSIAPDLRTICNTLAPNASGMISSFQSSPDPEAGRNGGIVSPFVGRGPGLVCANLPERMRSEGARDALGSSNFFVLREVWRCADVAGNPGELVVRAFISVHQKIIGSSKET